MNILIIKLSSIGDIIHTFPAIIEAKKNIKDLNIDWLVDESLVEVAHLLNKDNIFINEFITIPLRFVKQNKTFHASKIFFYSLLKLKTKQYDLIIDAQGLLKSALLAKFITSKQKVGLDWSSARESSATFLYDYKYKIEPDLHAIDKIRKLFSLALKYNVNYNKKDLYIANNIYNSLHRKNFPKLPELTNINNYIIFLHGTTWETKEWNKEYWDKLAKLINTHNMQIVITFANNNLQEYQLAQYLSQNNNIIILHSLNIEQIARLIANAASVIAVDTGFAHLAAALDVPSIGIYGATYANKSGIFGTKMINLQSNYHCSPCFAKQCLEYKLYRSKTKQPCLQEITPELVFAQLKQLLNYNNI